MVAPVLACKNVSVLSWHTAPSGALKVAVLPSWCHPTLVGLPYHCIMLAGSWQRKGTLSSDFGYLCHKQSMSWDHPISKPNSKDITGSIDLAF